MNANIANQSKRREKKCTGKLFRGLRNQNGEISRTFSKKKSYLCGISELERT